MGPKSNRILEQAFARKELRLLDVTKLVMLANAHSLFYVCPNVEQLETVTTNLRSLYGNSIENEDLLRPALTESKVTSLSLYAGGRTDGWSPRLICSM